MSRLRFLPLLLLLPLLACELTEVTVAQGEPTVVVHAVLHVRGLPKYVVLEWSRSGQAAPPFGGFAGDIPGRPPEVPIQGAGVSITGPDNPGDPCAATVAFVEDTVPGIYRETGCPRLSAGDRLLLQVTLPDRVVTGALTVPVITSASVRAGGFLAQSDSRGGFGQVIPLHRDRDTLRVDVGASFGRGLEISIRDTEGPDGTVFYTLTDTMRLAIRGDLVNPFEGPDDRGESVFRPGKSYQLILLVADTNYYDFLRSFNDPFTGRGFINHLTGGIGVFGSVDVIEHTLRVVADMDDPREGFYDVSGTVLGQAVSLEWELYLDGAGPSSVFSAFASGEWEAVPYSASVDGSFSGDSLHAHVILDPDPAQPGLVYVRRLRGRSDPAGTFPILVEDESGRQIGLLTFTRSGMR